MVGVEARGLTSMFSFLKKRRREQLRASAFPPEFIPILQSNVPVYRRLPDELRAQLHGHIQVLLAEKHFEGCNGLEITDEVRVTIAGEAALLLLNRETKYYPELLTVLVYPDVFYAEVEDNEGHIVSEYKEDRSGESWDMGVIILSWKDAVEHASTGRAGYNVVLHEFAHYLDMEDETMDGAPGLGSPRAYREWSRVFWEEYDRLRAMLGAGQPTFLDPYAASAPAEFFAVVTEAFFEKPRELELQHAGLYEQLRRYYRVDPARW